MSNKWIIKTISLIKKPLLAMAIFGLVLGFTSQAAEEGNQSKEGEGRVAKLMKVFEPEPKPEPKWEYEVTDLFFKVISGDDDIALDYRNIELNPTKNIFQGPSTEDIKNWLIRRNLSDASPEDKKFLHMGIELKENEYYPWGQNTTKYVVQENVEPTLFLIQTCVSRYSSAVSFMYAYKVRGIEEHLSLFLDNIDSIEFMNPETHQIEEVKIGTYQDRSDLNGQEFRTSNPEALKVTYYDRAYTRHGDLFLY